MATGLRELSADLPREHVEAVVLRATVPVVAVPDRDRRVRVRAGEDRQQRAEHRPTAPDHVGRRFLVAIAGQPLP